MEMPGAVTASGQERIVIVPVALAAKPVRVTPVAREAPSLAQCGSLQILDFGYSEGVGIIVENAGKYRCPQVWKLRLPQTAAIVWHWPIRSGRFNQWLPARKKI
ncbi:hypothetical protein SDC9_159275 [bioreactor metagenome]|uniref:Uncharacterized protein n=1 Tax=bioreactor metagenome TaxID=1076179 RepID=A0A645FEE4_9ZZZZ